MAADVRVFEALTIDVSEPVRFKLRRFITPASTNKQRSVEDARKTAPIRQGERMQNKQTTANERSISVQDAIWQRRLQLTSGK